jgi:hypothetical protein
MSFTVFTRERIAFLCSLKPFGYGQTQETFVVNMVFPAIVFAQAAVIVWLLMSRMHHHRQTALPSGGYGQPESSHQTAQASGPHFRGIRMHTHPNTY